MPLEDLCKGDVVVKQAAAHTKSASLDSVRTYSDIATLDCMIQTVGAMNSQKYSAKGSRFTHYVFFSSDPGLSVNNRLKWTTRAGVALTVPIYLRILDCYPEGAPGEDRLWIADCDQESTRSEN